MAAVAVSAVPVVTAAMVVMALADTPAAVISAAVTSASIVPQARSLPLGAAADREATLILYITDWRHLQ